MGSYAHIGGHISEDRHGFGSPVYERDKKTLFWMGGVLDCLSTVVALFRGAEYKQAKEDDWEVPYESVTDQVYLGCGAQGVVYSGILNGEIVAIKKLQHKSETNIKHLRKLNHENIVRFRGVSSVTPYCVIMEYCQYGPLFEFLHSGACFSPKQIMKWAKEIALGMSYLHTHKIIHRDLKSPNVLIADNLVVKVSDFGTSREWNNVSAIMSFTGTVAWMAPEVIRHEPYSERVDVWSYGVVLWELLTQEVPYKNMETHAIMWGVGTDTISLPIPSTWPGNLQMLLNQCWSRVPRQRPPFKIIAAHLEISVEDIFNMNVACFNTTQAEWRREVHVAMEKLYARTPKPLAIDEIAQRREDLKQARDVREVYEQQLCRANELFMEVCTVRLQLEQREKDILEREIALMDCRCGQRKNVKYFKRQISSSSDGLRAIIDIENRRKKKKAAAQVIVNFNDNKPTTALVATEEVPTCVCDNTKNNNMEIVTPKKELIVESNGNVVIKELVNDNHLANVAEV